MYLNDDDLLFLLLNALFIASLAICLLLLFFPRFRRRSNPFAWVVWINLAAGLLYYAQYPAAQMQETAFARADPGYAGGAKIFPGRSIYIPHPDRLHQAAYSCYGAFSSGSCTAPLAERIKEGLLDFVELGTDPIIRYEITIGNPACLDWNTDTPEELSDRFISPGLAACIIGTEVQKAAADHILNIEKRRLGWPSTMPYFHASLADSATGEIVDQFDGWDGATAYFLNNVPQEPRRPDGALAQILTIPLINQQYDRALDDQLLKDHGFDEALLLQASKAPSQSIRAQTLWLACRDEIVATLSADARKQLRDISGSVFGNAPDKRYPEGCRPWAR